MATATMESEPESIPEPIPERDDITKAKRQVFGRHIAHEGIMLDRVQRQLRTAEKMQKFAATGDPKDLEWTAEDEADMGVNIGNENHFHIETKEQSQAATSSAPTAVTAAKSVWPAAVVGASLLASGLGGGAGVGYIVNDLLKPEQPAPAASTDTDTDTITEFDFPKE
jgi:hypothetical protein